MQTLTPSPSFAKTNTHIIIASVWLLLVPLCIWASGYQWQISQISSDFDFLLFIITETGSAPIYGVLFSLFLFALLLRQYRQICRFKLILLIVLLIQGSAQIDKWILKSSFQIPRPYLSALIQTENEQNHFYAQKRSERSQIIHRLVAPHETHLPKWLSQHWQNETGYSFPSGHTAFAASWLMIFIICFAYAPTKGNFIINCGLGVWASLMLWSRVRLGMHFPIDLLASIIIVAINSLVFLFCLRKIQIKN